MKVSDKILFPPLVQILSPVSLYAATRSVMLFRSSEQTNLSISMRKWFLLALKRAVPCFRPISVEGLTSLAVHRARLPL